MRGVRLVAAFHVQLYRLMTYTSPSLELWLAPHELPHFATMLVDEMLLARPELAYRGLCVAIYDDALMPRYHFNLVDHTAVQDHGGQLCADDIVAEGVANALVRRE